MKDVSPNISILTTRWIKDYRVFKLINFGTCTRPKLYHDMSMKTAIPPFQLLRVSGYGVYHIYNAGCK